MDIRIGKVTHYYSHLGVAVLELDEPLQLGDTLLFLGHTTELIQEVTSLEVNHHKIQVAGPGQEIAVKVTDQVRAGDLVYKVVETEAVPQVCV
jgi:translation elongation factor EF-1alpha